MRHLSEGIHEIGHIINDQAFVIDEQSFWIDILSGLKSKKLKELESVLKDFRGIANQSLDIIRMDKPENAKAENQRFINAKQVLIREYSHLRTSLNNSSSDTIINHTVINEFMDLDSKYMLVKVPADVFYRVHYLIRKAIKISSEYQKELSKIILLKLNLPPRAAAFHMFYQELAGLINPPVKIEEVENRAKVWYGASPTNTRKAYYKIRSLDLKKCNKENYQLKSPKELEVKEREIIRDLLTYEQDIKEAIEAYKFDLNLEAARCRAEYDLLQITYKLVIT